MPMSQHVAPEEENEERSVAEGGSALTWFGLFCGPVAFAVDLQASYALVYPAARWGPGVLHGISAVALSLCLAGAAASMGALRRAAREAIHEGEDGSALDEDEKDERQSALARARFLAAAGIALSLMCGALVIGMAIPKLVLGPTD
jgi:hypothetical protein